MPEFLEITVDKFTFKVATDRLYTKEGAWVQPQPNNRVRLGVTDYVQRQSGDAAFVSVKPAGTRIKVGDEFAELETMKTALSLFSPVAGVVAAANPALEPNPELVNQDPYGQGWLDEIEVADWESDRQKLLEPSAYFEAMQAQIQEDLRQ